MMKKTLFAALALAAASPALAQSEQTTQNGDFTETVEYTDDKYKVETNHFWDNWFITLGVGPQMMFGDHDKQIGFGKRISPSLDIAVGKWFTPGIGVRLMYNGLSMRGATRWGGAHSTGDQVPGWGSGMYYSKFKYYNLRADVLFNLSNLFCGYRENRIWNSSFYAGVGYMRTWEAPTAGDVTMSAGWLNTFRLCDALDANIDLRASMVDDAIDGEIGQAKFDGLLGVTVGLTYKFKRRGWDRSKTVVRTNVGEINSLRDRLDRANAENARLRDELAKAEGQQKQEVINKVIASNLVIFRIGKADLSKEARANLQLLAEAIKAGDSKAVYTITGYADAGTGSQKINERLSKKRAEAVYDCLVNEFGVSESQLKVDYKGGVENMFYDDPRLSRAVITRAN